MADRAVAVVVMPVPTRPVDGCRIRRIAAVDVFGNAQLMLRTFHSHLVFMHEGQKPCGDIAQRKQNMADS